MPLQRPFHARHAALLVALSFASAALAAANLPAEPLLDWSDWEKYRATVVHPSGAFKPADVARAKENLQRYGWAQAYLAKLESSGRAALAKLTPGYLEAMIPETTPGDSKFTPCPACRDRGKPVHPHGQWSWRESAPEELTCDVCHTAFPNEKYPEDVVLHTTWGKPQTLTFVGGEPFVIFSYKTGRPSMTANIRARKVAHLAALSRSLAEAYLLTGKTEYARGVRAILLRFAACYPHWLVHTGYGEFADLDPHVAAQLIERLPAPELCPPPNIPDRKLHTGYWSAGRASGVGQESGFVRRMVESYDFTCTAHDGGRDLYPDEEKRTIERDLLLEGSVLLACDKKINNKSVGNRTAAALVGLCVGHPGLVRFGWDGFQQTLDDWFLPDATTSESPSYALMTLGNIWDMPQALRGYSEPADYAGPDGQRRTAVDLYHGTAYERVWANSYAGLQGDLLYPPFADAHRTSSLSSHFVELMVANYPERPEYLGLLQEICGPNLDRGQAGLALYYREPGLEQKSARPVTLPDWCPPELRIGHLRTGPDGRESLLLLSASRWGSHHHADSLNLYYWKNGQEVLSDLGYLWDHPQKHQTTRTLAHNTVLIDEKEQETKLRGGDVEFFQTSPHVKVMAARSQAYPNAQLYRRTSAVIEHGGGRNYVVDFFTVEGGARQDYVFHAAQSTCEIDGATTAAADMKLYDFKQVRTIAADRVWRAHWKSGALTCVAWNLAQPGETAFVADGWGQRDWHNTDVGATVPYIVRRTEGPGLKTFVSVFEATAGESFVRAVRLESPGVLAVETRLGTDYILSQPEPGTLSFRAGTRSHRLDGRFAVASVQADQLAWTFNAARDAASNK